MIFILVFSKNRLTKENTMILKTAFFLKKKAVFFLYLGKTSQVFWYFAKTSIFFPKIFYFKTTQITCRTLYNGFTNK